MASKTGSTGLVGLVLLFQFSLVTAIATANMTVNIKSTHSHTPTGTVVPTFSLASNATATPSTVASALNASVVDCFITVPKDPLSAAGLSTPYLLMPPCSMAVGTQQAFMEAAVFDPATGEISIYHPLVVDAGVKPAVAPVVPTLPDGASVALWAGFNGDTLQLLDVNGKDTNASPLLKAVDCVNGLPGVKGDIFGQVSWCNTQPFFAAVNASIAAGKTKIPPLGTDKNGQTCPSSRSFTIVDQDPSDNLPTQYLLLADNTTIQDTAANRAKYPDATVINNASDEALVGDILDPILGCTAFHIASLDDPGATVSSLVSQELQAGLYQTAPLALVALNDPDCLLTSNGVVSPAKTNAYRLGVNQPFLGDGPGTDDGSLVNFCNNMILIAPPFFQINQAKFTAAATPDAGVGNSLFTFMCNRYLQSFVNLVCPPAPFQPVTCVLDGNGAATSCKINLKNATSTTGGSGTGGIGTGGTGTGGTGTGGTGTGGTGTGGTGTGGTGTGTGGTGTGGTGTGGTGTGSGKVGASGTSPTQAGGTGTGIGNGKVVGSLNPTVPASPSQTGGAGGVPPPPVGGSGIAPIESQPAASSVGFGNGGGGFGGGYGGGVGGGVGGFCTAVPTIVSVTETVFTTITVTPTPWPSAVDDDGQDVGPTAAATTSPGYSWGGAGNGTGNALPTNMGWKRDRRGRFGRDRRGIGDVDVRHGK